jgi:hypothetical protein
MDATRDVELARIADQWEKDLAQLTAAALPEKPAGPVTAIAAQADISMIRQALGLLVLPGGVVEIRALDVPAGRGKPVTVAGYFTDLDKAAQAAVQLDKSKPAGVYLLLNEINSALLARSPNGLTRPAKLTTSDGDVRQTCFVN